MLVIGHSTSELHGGSQGPTKQGWRNGVSKLPHTLCPGSVEGVIIWKRLEPRALPGCGSTTSRPRSARVTRTGRRRTTGPSPLRRPT